MSDSNKETTEAKSLSTTKPVFSFGVIADVQYATHEDAWNFSHTVLRSFSNSLNILKSSVEYFNSLQLSFVANLGDIIDQRCSKLGTSKSDLKVVLDEFKRMKCKQITHIIGNHELYNFDREELKDLLNTTNGNENKSTWYSYRPVDNIPFRIIVLDTYDVSTIQGTTAERTQQAYDFLSAKNPNEINKHGVNWLSGLKGEDRRFLPYNGAISKEQLDFLDRTCQEADENDEKCLVMGHVQILPGSCSSTTVLWNYKDVLEIFHKYNSIVGYIAGHDHSGGYKQDEAGIHYLTLPSPLETEKGDMCFASVDVYDDKMRINCVGKKMDRLFPKGFMYFRNIKRILKF